MGSSLLLFSDRQPLPRLARSGSLAAAALASFALVAGSSPSALQGRSGQFTPLVQVSELLAPDGAQDDNFGSDVAISGDTAVVSARFDDDQGPSSGSVYVFVRNPATGGWRFQAKLLPDDGSTFSNFGDGLAIENDTLLIGSTSHFHNPANYAEGSVYVFTRDGSGTWTQVAELQPRDTTSGMRFGVSIALQGDTAIIGAEEDDHTGPTSGAVYVFERDASGVWSEKQDIPSPDGGGLDNFGISVDLDGDTMVVGANLHGGHPSPFTLTGAAYVYERDVDGTWSLAQELLASDGQHGDWFGVEVGISGDRILVAATSVSAPVSAQGAVYVFERNAGGAWVETERLTLDDPGNLDLFGNSLAMEGNRAVVASYLHDDNAVDSGWVFLYEWDQAGNWTRTRYQADDVVASDLFGFEVAFDGNRFLAGSIWSDDKASSAGSAYVVAPSLSAPQAGAVSVGQGGSALLEIHAGAARGGLTYWVLASLSGSSPGIHLPGTNLLLPLNNDAVFQLTLNYPNLPGYLGNTLGSLNEIGWAQATFSLPPNSPPVLAGQVLDFAFAVLDGAGQAVYTSNNVSIPLLP